MSKNGINLYIHIPFCKSKCRYCGFFSQVGKESCLPSYFQALEKEITSYKQRLQNYQISSIYIGGGTPSLVNPDSIEKILNSCKENFDIKPDAEISIEANPETITSPKLEQYKKMGINRLSLGLQAWQDNLLQYLGRNSQTKDFLKAYDLARKAGFININVDLIFGIPNQTIDDWNESLEQVTKLNPEHISCYSLEIDEKSVFGKLYEQGRLEVLDEKHDRKMYRLARKKLKNAGYNHYEISNFAKSGFECRHNLDFWNYQQYIGFGAAAHSFFENSRYSNIYSIEDHVKNLLSGKLILEDSKQVILKKQMIEFTILGLRLIEGLNTKRFENLFGKNILEVLKKQFKKLEQLNLISIKKDKIKLTSRGLNLLDQVTLELI